MPISDYKLLHRSNQRKVCQIFSQKKLINYIVSRIFQNIFCTVGKKSQSSTHSCFNTTCNRLNCICYEQACYSYEPQCPHTEVWKSLQLYSISVGITDRISEGRFIPEQRGLPTDQQICRHDAAQQQSASEIQRRLKNGASDQRLPKWGPKDSQSPSTHAIATSWGLNPRALWT